MDISDSDGLWRLAEDSLVVWHGHGLTVPPTWPPLVCEPLENQPMTTVPVHRSLPADSTYVRQGAFPLRVWCALHWGVNDDKIKAAVEKVAADLAAEMKAEGFADAEVRPAEVVSGWLLKYEAIVYVKHDTIVEDSFPMPHMSSADYAKFKAATHVSKRKADKGTGKGIVQFAIQ